MHRATPCRPAGAVCGPRSRRGSAGHRQPCPHRPGCTFPAPAPGRGPAPPLPRSGHPPTRRRLAGIPVDQVVSQPWVSPSQPQVARRLSAPAGSIRQCRFFLAADGLAADAQVRRSLLRGCRSPAWTRCRTSWRRCRAARWTRSEGGMARRVVGSSRCKAGAGGGRPSRTTGGSKGDMMVDSTRRTILKTGAAATVLAATRAFAGQAGQDAEAMSFYENGPVRIRYEEAGSGFPLLVIAGGGTQLVDRRPGHASLQPAGGVQGRAPRHRGRTCATPTAANLPVRSRSIGRGTRIPMIISA